MIRPRKVLSLVIPLTLLVLVGVAFWTFGGVEAASKWMRPPLVQTRGIVLMDGKPLQSGSVVSYPRGGTLPASRGEIDAEGRFVLKTDVDGRIVEGAYVGEHRVTVTVLGRTASMAPALNLLKNSDYGTAGVTPLRIVVSRDAHRNQEFILELSGGFREDEPIAPRSASTGMIVEPLLRTLDSNGDGRLDESEMERADPTRLYGINLAECDENNDHIVDYDELVRAAKKAYGDEDPVTEDPVTEDPVTEGKVTEDRVTEDKPSP